MKHYQKFLSSNPTFLGLTVFDLLTLCLGLNLALILQIESDSTLPLILVLVAGRKMLFHYIDFIGLILGLKRVRKLNLSKTKVD